MYFRILPLLFLTASIFSISGALAKEPAKVRAVSLKVLQERVNACQNKGGCSEDLLQLAGLKKITGYVVDGKNRDLILIGSNDRNLPPLYLEDFVVALKNVWLNYAIKKGNTFYYSDPGCSIDPNPLVIQRLQRIGEGIFGSSSEELILRGIKEWNQVCPSPQKVRVLGIPFDNRFASVMVKADYDMKKLVDGSEKLNIPGFISLTDLTLKKAKEDIQNKREISLAVSSMNRFWFSPGENRYKEDKGVIIIEKSPVVLLTEEEHLNRKGEITGKNRPDPLAHQFCEMFTSKYQEIAKENPIYTDLENLFHWVALAKILKFKSALAEANLDLSYLLDHYPIPQTKVSPQLPGRSNVKEFKHEKDLSRGRHQTVQFWLPTCGGVGMNLKVDQSNFIKETTTKIVLMKTTIIKSRPSTETLFWDPPVTSMGLIK
jgi:hypothetical protein